MAEMRQDTAKMHLKRVSLVCSRVIVNGHHWTLKAWPQCVCVWCVVCGVWCVVCGVWCVSVYCVSVCGVYVCVSVCVMLT